MFISKLAYRLTETEEFNYKEITMSEQTKTSAKEASEYLRTAGDHLDAATKRATESGDKKLSERVTKVTKEVKEIHKELDHRLKNG